MVGSKGALDVYGGAAKNKEVEEYQHQALVSKKDLNILENAKEGVEMKLERSAQTIKNEAFKVTSENFRFHK